MFQGNLTLVVALLIGVIAVSLILLIMVIVLKIARDRRELRSGKFRDAVWQGWVDNDVRRMAKTCRAIAGGGHQVQSDVISLSDRARAEGLWTPERLATLRLAADKAGLPKAIRRQLKSRNDVKRGLAVALAGYPGPDLEPQELAPYLADEDQTGRLAAAGSLERMAGPQAADVLITALADRVLPDERVIERLGHPWAVPSIVRALADSSRGLDSRVRCGLARALALAEDPSSLPSLETMVIEGNVDERVQALKALVSCYPNASVEQRMEIGIFARGYIDDDHPVVRAQAAHLLGLAGVESDIPVLTSMVTDSDWFVRRAAARSLVQMGRPGMAALRRVAASDDKFAAQRAKEEIAFATIMAARRSAETGEDLDGILALGGGITEAVEVEDEAEPVEDEAAPIEVEDEPVKVEDEPVEDEAAVEVEDEEITVEIEAGPTGTTPVIRPDMTDAEAVAAIIRQIKGDTDGTTSG